MSRSRKNNYLSRREFIHIGATIGGVAALSSFLNACAGKNLPVEATLAEVGTEINPTPISTIKPSATIQSQQATSLQPTRAMDSPSAQPNNTSQVALVRTDDRSQGVRTAIELLGINPFLGKQTFLKPNFNSADPTPGSTHPDVLRTLVLQLKEMGATSITVGDRSGMGDTNTVMRNLGVYQMAQEIGFDALVLNDLHLKDWVEFQPPGSRWNQGFLVARPCLEAETLVQTCCLKTHAFGGVFTMSLKNSVGMIAKRHPTTGYEYMQELHTSQYQTSMIAEINSAYTPSLIVMDGMEAFIQRKARK